MLLPDGLGESKGTKGIVVMRGETGGGDLYRTSGHADFKKTGINIADLACNAPPVRRLLKKYFVLSPTTTKTQKECIRTILFSSLYIFISGKY